ncbi:MAG: HAMP domain-containing protein [Chloroflexi bacterium]|nr:HAMP domain-containing protein [Chloroflexota bacterium]
MRRNLLLAFTFSALVGIGLVVVWTHLSFSREMRTFFRQGGPWGLQEITAALEEHYRRTGSWEGAEAILHAATPHRTPQNGDEPLAEGPAMGPGPLVLADAEGRVIYPPSRRGTRLTDAERRRAIPLEVNGQVVGYLYSPRGGPVAWDTTRPMFQRLTQAALLAALVAVAISSLLAWALSQRILRPLSALQAAAQRLAQGDRNVRVPEDGDEELRALARAFNRMAQALQEAEEARRRLTADIAHELRTPLAVQQAQIEALLDGVYELTPERLLPILEQNRLLARLVEDLRTLSLAEEGRLPLHQQTLDLRDILRQNVEQFRAVAQAEGITLHFDVPDEPLLVHADPERLAQVLHNLLANALRHTPRGGRIEIAARREGNQAVFWVRDTGPGLPPGTEDRVFQRFYRVDRARDRQRGGTGLGLSIVRALVQAHQGHVRAYNHPEGGAVFEVRLPLAPS